MKKSVIKVFVFSLCLGYILFCISELLDLNRTSVFHSPFGFLNLQTMLLDEYQERLFVGGKDLVYSLSLEHISSGYREVWKSKLYFRRERKGVSEKSSWMGITWIRFFIVLTTWAFWVIILLKEIKYTLKIKSFWEDL